MDPVFKKGAVNVELYLWISEIFDFFLYFLSRNVSRFIKMSIKILGWLKDECIDFTRMCVKVRCVTQKTCSTAIRSTYSKNRN